MKTQVRWKSSVLQTFQAPPATLAPLLELHFRKKWPVLQALGLSMWPPLVDSPRSLQQIREGCTEPNGTTWGTRFFDVLPPGYLVSPTSKWVWETAEQVVPAFSNSQAVRGHHGFHAAWVTDLANWLDSTVDHHSTKCKALVLGHGDIVLGDIGWRSSKMTVVRAAASTDIENLRKRYPTVVFQEYSEGSTISVAESFEFPYEVNKLDKWLRERSLKALKDEFS